MSKKIRTYLDTCVLLFAYSSENPEYKQAAWKILNDENREFIFSDFLKIETIPKPTFQRRTEEVEFMNAMFESCSEYCLISAKLMNKAVELASQYDIAPMDALHVTAAIFSNVDEFYTFEKQEKPMCASRFQKELNVISLAKKNIEKSKKSYQKDN